ncbi:hypothetical protein A9Q79_04270 [Methylophaga sp. 42_25_T18]|nr:hypothetical protein A9Q79_04270 [Methylophaga sp. 42_25_T18]OUR88689.1 hypothetical protein A9Q92_02610 [Methylophaga sp. 42_8_T64]
MNSINKNVETWYGELRTQRGNAIIIRDAQLPAANKGRIYLYNSERNAIIEYDESIVTSKLFPLSEEDEELAKAEYDKPWHEVQKKFIRSHKPHTSPQVEDGAVAATN